MHFYGFKKMKKGDNEEFFNRYFIRGNLKSIALIKKRKISKKNSYKKFMGNKNPNKHQKFIESIYFQEYQNEKATKNI